MDCWIQSPAGHMKLSIELAPRRNGALCHLHHRLVGGYRAPKHGVYFDPDRGVVPKQGEIDVKGFAQVIELMAEAGELVPPLRDAERFIDLQLLKAAGLQ